MDKREKEQKQNREKVVNCAFCCSRCIKFYALFSLSRHFINASTMECSHCTTDILITTKTKLWISLLSLCTLFSEVLTLFDAKKNCRLLWTSLPHRQRSRLSPPPCSAISFITFVYLIVFNEIYNHNSRRRNPNTMWQFFMLKIMLWFPVRDF